MSLCFIYSIVVCLEYIQHFLQWFQWLLLRIHPAPLSFVPHRCCLSHTQCRSTLQRRLSPFWVVWRWMMKRLQRLRCRSSRTQEARWKKVFLTSNRTFHCLIDSFIRCLACSSMYAILLYLIIHNNNTVIIHILAWNTCFECAALCNGALLPAPPSVLLPVLQAKAKRGPPRQAKYAIHCINAMFTNRDTHFAQIFEVSQSHRFVVVF